MYSIDDRDEVEELSNVPQSSIGAPLPPVVATEHSLRIAYVVETTDPNWDGTTVQIVHHDVGGEVIAVVEFSSRPRPRRASRAVRW